MKNISKREILYANLLGALFVIVSGILVEHFLNLDSWVKGTVIFTAFLVYALSEKIWIIGRNLAGKK